MNQTHVRRIALLALIASGTALPCLASAAVESYQEYQARTAPRKPTETLAQYEERSRPKTKLTVPMGKVSPAGKEKFESTFKATKVETLEEYNARQTPKSPAKKP